MKFMYLCTAFMSTQPLHNLFHSDLIKNSGKLLSANVIAQAISLLIYPVLTRIYSQADFGLLNLYSSIVAIIVILSTAQYQYAIPIPKDNNISRGSFHVGLIVLLLCTILLILLLPFSHPVASVFNAPELAHYLWLVPVSVLFLGFWQLLNYWYTRQKNFNSISGFQISQTLFSAGGKLGMGWMGKAGGLLYASAFAPMLSVLFSVIAHRKCLKPLMEFHKEYCYQAAKQFKNFPLFTMPRGVINNFSNNLPALLLTSYFGLNKVGLWGMAMTLSFIPINIIAGSLYQVFFQRIAERVNAKQSIRSFFRKYWLWATLISLVLFAILFVVLPDLSEWLLGSGWRLTGEFIRWMLPWLCLTILLSPHGYLPDLFYKQRIELFFEIALFVVRIVALVVGIHLSDFTLAIAGYCLGSAFVKMAMFIWYGCIIEKYERLIAE